MVIDLRMCLSQTTSWLAASHKWLSFTNGLDCRSYTLFISLFRRNVFTTRPLAFRNIKFALEILA